MTNVLIAGHRFRDIPSFSMSNGERCITVAVPFETEKSVLAELQDAENLEVTDPLGREIAGSYRLLGWRGTQTFSSKGQLQYLITWAIPNPDETERLKQKIDELVIQNEELTQVLLELASYIGSEKREESDQ